MYRLLVVDDEKDIRENIRYLINWSRYGINQIETAATYEEAVNKALDIRPHIILMDVKLGDGRWGYELVEHLRASGLKAVCGMISGYDDFQYIKRAMQASAKDYLLKPINVEELEQFVERAIVEELKGRLPLKSGDAPDVDPVLKGEYSHNIDAKGRIIIPAKMRDDLGEHFVITKGMENCLYVYPEDEWNAFEEKLNALPTTTDKKARAFAYFFQGSAIDGDLDKQGRTLISSVLRDYAKLDKEVVFIGMGKRAEIWDKARWDEKNAEVELSIEDIASDMEASGFSI